MEYAPDVCVCSPSADRLRCDAIIIGRPRNSPASALNGQRRVGVRRLHECQVRTSAPTPKVRLAQTAADEVAVGVHRIKTVQTAGELRFNSRRRWRQRR